MRRTCLILVAPFITPSLAHGQPERTASTINPSLAYYFILIQDKISGNWNPPKIGLGVAATINLSANVLRSGQVLGLTIKSSSGDRLLDDSALRAVSLSTPLPPLPPLFKAETLLLELQFTALSDKATGQLRTRLEVGSPMAARIEESTDTIQQRREEEELQQQYKREKAEQAKKDAQEPQWRRKIEANLSAYLPGKRFQCIGGKLDPICVGESRNVSSEVGPVVTSQHFGRLTGIHGHYWRGLACRIYWADGVVRAIACE